MTAQVVAAILVAAVVVGIALVALDDWAGRVIDRHVTRADFMYGPPEHEDAP